jgi:hypothetical protein
MEDEHSSVIKEVVGVSEMEVPRPEERVVDSSPGDTSDDRSGDDTDTQGEGSEAVDLRESSRNYEFGSSIITVGRVRQLAALGYFTEGSMQDLEEEVILEPAEDKAVVFEEFFAAGLRMPPQKVLADILVKFQVQLHQLTPNVFAQLSKYFWVVMSFGGEPSSD